MQIEFERPKRSKYDCAIREEGFARRDEVLQRLRNSAGVSLLGLLAGCTVDGPYHWSDLLEETFAVE